MKKSNEKIIDEILKKIESDLEYVDIDELIELSGFSYFHFHRLFCAYMGESLKQYIKRIRLERSAYELNYKRLSITEVALNAGFATPSAFNKAFKDFFKTTPSKYKKTNIRTKEFKMIKPVEIIDMEPIEVYSVRHIGDYNKIGIAFEKLMKWAYKNKIQNKKNLMGKDAYGYGISYDDPNVTDIDKLRSDACTSATDEVELEGDIVKQTISGGKYAVFLHKGEYSKLKHTYNDIFSSYVKDNDIKLRDVPIFERYLNRDPRRTKPENLKTEIHIPIQ